MSSEYEVNVTNSKLTCRGCLATSDSVYAMTNEEIFVYRNLINKVPYTLEMYVCVYCGHFLRKIAKFVEQCHRADEILSNIYGHDTKSVIPSILHFTSQTFTHQIGPDELSDTDIFDDYDDVPLVMLRSDSDHGGKVKKRKRKKVKSEELQDTELDSIKVELIEEQNGDGQCDGQVTTNKTKRQKVVREGFSSRMVQETDEYVVIKLTKEQVLQEMQERASSDEYRRTLYKCEKCVKGFNFEDVLRTHMEKHSMENGTLLCDICSQYCPTAVSLRGHMKSHTTRYSCKVCGLQRGSRQHLLEHHSISHTSTAVRYSCQRCIFTTKMFRGEKHVSQRRSGRSWPRRWWVHAASLPGDGGQQQPMQRLPKQPRKRRHVASTNSSGWVPAGVSPHELIGGESTQSSKRTVMQRHARSHSARERYACHRCGELFKNLETLRVHTVRHDKSKRLQCEQCSRSFIYPSMLHKHMQAVHEREDYYCVECDVKFKSQDNLRLHFKKAKRHRDASSYKYQCPNCPQRFVTPSSLSGHLSSAHGEPKQHSCELCRREYSTREALRAHIRSAHTDARAEQTCRVCKRSFTRKSILSAHVRTHTGERPFACECGAAFAQRATLRAHSAAKHHKKPEDSAINNEIVPDLPNEA